MILHGDCLDVLKTLPDNSIDSIVTDPPYGLSFMGKKWDYDVPSVEIWAECLRVLKPGGYLLAFAGTRTQHRMAVRIEDAGFEIRDMIAWVYGSGFPKSHNIALAIDKASGKTQSRGSAINFSGKGERSDIKTSVSAKNGTLKSAYVSDNEWQGWGTALKPALEPITVARKPLIGTVAENVLAHGTGGINVDGCRVGTETITQHGRVDSENIAMSGRNYAEAAGRAWEGRWPANLIHDGSEDVLALTGDAARFFYCAKASKRDRDEGVAGVAGVAGVGALRDNGRQSLPRKNNHPTVKPTDLMRYLCRLVTPPNGTVLDPFCGSGSTGKAATLEGFEFIGIEREAEYVDIATARINAALESIKNKHKPGDTYDLF
jgi:site-specific DNA-methyltransferase (adenine-specific)